MRIVRYTDVPSTPWANGAGETRELWSEGAGEGTGFTRRISIASLSRPAPFSHLPGVIRTFMPLDDILVRLLIDGQPVLLRRLEMARFAGRTAVSLVEIDRPGRVLNVMSEAGAWDHAVTVGAKASACDAALIVADHAPLSTGDLLIDPAPADMASLTAATIRFIRP